MMEQSDGMRRSLLLAGGLGLGGSVMQTLRAAATERHGLGRLELENGIAPVAKLDAFRGTPPADH